MLDRYRWLVILRIDSGGMGADSIRVELLLELHLPQEREQNLLATLGAPGSYTNPLFPCKQFNMNLELLRWKKMI